jgi:hypothetical protein
MASERRLVGAAFFVTGTTRSQDLPPCRPRPAPATRKRKHGNAFAAKIKQPFIAQYSKPPRVDVTITREPFSRYPAQNREQVLRNARPQHKPTLKRYEEATSFQADGVKSAQKNQKIKVFIIFSLIP